MASLWKKTLFYLGLVDDDQIESSEDPSGSEPQSQVRTVEPPAMPRASRQAETSASRSRRSSGGIAGRRVEPPKTARRRMSANPRLAEAGVFVESPGGALRGESEVIEARTFSDAQALADFIRAGTPVVLDLRTTEPAMVRRLVDFATGLTYALEGRMAKVNQGVILITPVHSVIGVEEQQRLADLGLYQTAAD